MHCKVCGAECGRFVLCRKCNDLKNEGKVVKCPVCKKWHYVTEPCDCVDSAAANVTENIGGGTVVNETEQIKENGISETHEEPTAERRDMQYEDATSAPQNVLREEPEAKTRNVSQEEPSEMQTDEKYLYNKKPVVTQMEKSYMTCIQEQLPEGYHLLLQSNLATFIEKNDSSKYQNELFRNVDFLVTDADYIPQFVIEINDRSHNTYQRRERDKKVHMICDEAGIPIITLWTFYGVSSSYIKKRISETIEALPVKRVHHFSETENIEQAVSDYKSQTAQYQRSYTPARQKSRRGCYIATCVYGSYDCPQVWTLRRFRDGVLDKNIFGRLFIKAYYAVSPALVSAFGNCTVFKRACRRILDRLVDILQRKGIDSSRYFDK